MGWFDNWRLGGIKFGRVDTVYKGEYAVRRYWFFMGGEWIRDWHAYNRNIRFWED